MLDEPLFILSHLYRCVHSEEAEEALFGDAYDTAEQLHSELMACEQWLSFSPPLPRSHRLLNRTGFAPGDVPRDQWSRHAWF